MAVTTRTLSELKEELCSTVYDELQMTTHELSSVVRQHEEAHQLAMADLDLAESQCANLQVACIRMQEDINIQAEDVDELRSALLRASGAQRRLQEELDSSESIRRSMCQQQSARIAAAQEDAASGREMPVAQIEADAINLEDGRSRSSPSAHAGGAGREESGGDQSDRSEGLPVSDSDSDLAGPSAVAVLVRGRVRALRRRYFRRASSNCNHNHNLEHSHTSACLPSETTKEGAQSCIDEDSASSVDDSGSNNGRDDSTPWTWDYRLKDPACLARCVKDYRQRQCLAEEHFVRARKIKCKTTGVCTPSPPSKVLPSVSSELMNLEGCVLMALVDLEAAKKHTSNSSKRANCASGSPGPRSRLGSKSTKRTMRSVNALTSRKTPPIVRQSREYTRPSSQSSSPIVGRVRNISKEQARRSEKPIQRALSFRGENENTCLENADDTVQMVHIARVLHDQCS
mmetsp:Transcript_32481/g.61053  ORF Transcript_32481/g.61053 Transcript_32481/m.61053 type:complete len:459 (-) Transcript_32481:82-1458(-)